MPNLSLTCAAIIIISLLFLVNFYNIPVILNRNHMTSSVPRLVTSKTKFILMYNHKQHQFKRHTSFSDCPLESDCVLTYDKDFFGPGNTHQFDAILVNPDKATTQKAAFEASKLRQDPKQRIVMQVNEPPRKIDIVNKKYLSNYFFNWTWTYSPDSDIQWSYVPSFQLASDPTPDPHFWHGPIWYNNSGGLNLDKRKELIFWMVSDCHPVWSKRHLYVEKLKRFLPVKIFGLCGNRTACPPTKRSLENGNAFSDEEVEEERKCFSKLAEGFKFYLSFENSLCDHYVTEKLVKALENNVVPIVMGGADYAQIAPPNSFINVADFETVKELANYIKFLDSNDEAYKSYFAWQEQYVGYERLEYCILCSKLHNDKEPVKEYPNMFDWFYYAKNSNFTEPVCKSPESTRYFADVISKELNDLI